MREPATGLEVVAAWNDAHQFERVVCHFAWIFGAILNSDFWILTPQ